MLKSMKMMFFLLAASLMMTGNVCAWVTNPANGHQYELTTITSDWLSCEAEAVSKGGHLATINNDAEETWIRGNIGTDRYWMGFTDQAVEGTWVWIAGDGGYWKSGDPGSTSYANWVGGEPNNATPPAWGEDYGVMNWTGTNWNDYDSARPELFTYRGVIEVVPIPSALLLVGSGLAGLCGWRRLRG